MRMSSLRYTLCNVEGNSACSGFHRYTYLLTPRFYHRITCPPLTKKLFPLLPLYYCATQCPIIWYCPPFFRSNSFRLTMSAPNFHIHRNIFQKFVVNFSLVLVHILCSRKISNFYTTPVQNQYKLYHIIDILAYYIQKSLCRTTI